MLKETWNIQMLKPRFANTSFIFTLKGREDIYISVESDEESDAWEKLGKLLGKEDKELGESEVFEGLVSVYNRHGYTNADISLFVAKQSLKSLEKYNDRRVEVTVKIM